MNPVVIGNATLYHGDCREILQSMAPRSAQCIITSPPYFGLRDYGVAAQIGMEQSPSEYVEQLVGVFRAAREVLADDGTLWLNLGDSYSSGIGSLAKSRDGNPRMNGGVSNRKGVINADTAPKNLLGIPWRVAFALQADGWFLRSDIIWHKPNPMPESVTDRPTKSHEYLFLLSKQPRYYFDAEAIKERCSYPGDHGFLRGPIQDCDSEDISWRAKSQQSRKISGVDSRNAGGEQRNRRSVWTVPTQSNGEAHFAMFPEALITPCVLAGCPEGGTVLDPFGGAGTTAVVALKQSRKAIVIEINATYLNDIAVPRITEAQKQLRLFA
jgi:DNA modification methylase